jgi:AcrR family transcriptional regulator
MSRTKTASFEIQKALIQNAAATLFAKEGFHNTSMSELASFCNISKPLLYHYYKDKEEILFNIASDYMGELLSLTKAPKLDGLKGEVRLRALIADFMKQYEHAQAQHIVLTQDVKFLSAERHDEIIFKQREVVKQFNNVICEMCPELSGRKLDKPITMVLFGMINWTFTWLRSDGQLSYEQMGRLATDLFISGVKGMLKSADATMLESAV